MAPSIYDRVRDLASETLGVPLDTIDETTSTATVEEWDSLQHLNLMMSIEDAFGVEVNPEDMESMTDIASIVSFLERAGAGVGD
jgi:acyl carrier protein